MSSSLFQQHKAKIITITCFVLLALILLHSMNIITIYYSPLADYLAHLGWLITVSWLFYFVHRSYKIFKNDNLLLAMIAFALLVIAYWTIVVIQTLIMLGRIESIKEITLLGINAVITLGYLFLAIAMVVKFK